MAHIKKMTDKPRRLPWRAQVKRKGHPTQVKMFQTRAQAERWAHEQEKNILEVGLPLTIKHLERHTVGDIVRRYLKEVTPHKGSVVSETSVLNAFLRREFCKKSLAYVKRQDAHAYIEARKTDVWRGKLITPRTIRRECNSIQHVFEVAKERWGFENLTNPFRGIEIKGSMHRRKRRLEDGELALLDEACKGCRAQNQYYAPLAIYLAIETAMRLQEIFSLKWADIDIEKRQIEIRKSKTDHASSYEGRTIVLSVNAGNYLMPLAVKLAKEGKFKWTNNVFPMNKNAFKQTWMDAVKRAGITNLTFHDLRREAGSRFDEAGLTKAEHDLMMGHANRDMAGLYIRSSLNSIRDKLDRYALKGHTLKEVHDQLAIEGVPAEVLVRVRAYALAFKRGLTPAQTEKSVELAVRNWKKANQPHNVMLALPSL
ncbi:site-specific integrase [Bradyrhizobium sp. AUGA SZCCT0169]|uniref:tyrosine-type recombinase/integrase n=1 Tax=Bradyrhizobium sp. AUGA SZCCT0169 TaxID=2807663 RepID=UPI001BAAFF47|nr:site-specific integrase [Bradyrhizobium sp. AUGA SZCCT0169]MBR1245509.1 site-specific integrase [Bradyrhizobium sp. AUGA SZCCT0169]